MFGVVFNRAFQSDKGEDMVRPAMLWVDLRSIRDQVSSYHDLSDKWAVSRISNPEEIDLVIRKESPILVFFEYDYPDISSLSALRQVKNSFPAIPIIMLTEQHSEALAVWALRIRAGDYLVKPLQTQELMASVTTILAEKVSPKDKINEQYPSSNPLPAEFRCRVGLRKKTYPAQTFVENRYHEKIYQEEVAQLCGMNASTFSRNFKKEHMITFRGYLTKYRIRKAQKLLQNPNARVTDIAYTVGFQDPSYFTRTFRRVVGTSPSLYHEAHIRH